MRQSIRPSTAALALICGVLLCAVDMAAQNYKWQEITPPGGQDIKWSAFAMSPSGEHMIACFDGYNNASGTTETSGYVYHLFGR